MDVRSPFFQNIALILAGVLFLNPIVATAAQLAVDAQAGGNTSLGQAGNGVPIVNIATPNGSGLSHNKFSDYNVGQQGLILNNATERLQGTQQGGIILGNPNLNGRAAGVILNEVTGSNRSQLQGYTEVAGQAAHVIVANPHGISCDGCGFLNTPRATLSTGTPVIDNGQLRSFDVNGGDIAIEGAGLNASNLDQFDLITRSAKLNAELHAQRLNVITGRNEVDAATLQATAKTADGSEAPLLAIDSSALGGMYAGAIRLVGTEAGVGVKLAGDLAASAGDIHIDANGQLTLARTAASENLSLAARGVDLSGPAYAGGNVAIDSAATLSNRQSLAAAGSIALQAGHLDNSGIVEAGVEANNSRNATGDVSLDSTSLRNTGRVVASRDLQVQAQGTLDNQGGTLSGQALTQVQAGALDNRQGRILSRDEVQLSATSLDNADAGLISAGRAVTLQAETLGNREGEISSQGTLRIAGDQLDNRQGRLIGEQALSIDASGGLRNSQGVLSSNTRLELRAGSLDNSGQGTLISQDVLRVQVDGLLDNSADGALVGQGRLDVQAAQVDNRGGRLLAGDELSLEVGHVDNSARGVIDSRGAARVDVAHLDNRDAGSLVADGPLSLSAERIDNAAQGRIASQGDLSLRVGELHQQGGELVSQGALSVQGERLDNSHGGLLAAGRAIDLALATVDNRGGEISSAGRVGIVSAALDNSEAGRVIGDQGLQLTVQRLLNHTKGVLSGRDGLLLRGGSLDNSAGGTLSSLVALDITLAGTLDNHAGGLLVSEGRLALEAAHLDNREAGTLSSADTLSVTVAHVDNRAGRLLADGHLSVVGSELDNSQAGVISAKAGVSLDSVTLNNDAAGRIVSGDTLSLRAEQVSNRDGGRIAASGALSAVAGALDQRGGQLLSESSLSLDMRQGVLNNSDNGLLASSGALTLSGIKALDNSRGGEISSDQGFLLAAGSLDNSGGRILSAGQLRLRIDTWLKNVLGGVLSGGTGLSVASARLDNSAGGILSSGGELDVLASELDNQDRGTLSAATTLRLHSTTLNNANAGLLASGAGLELASETLHNEGGQILAQGDLAAQLGTFVNHDGVLSARQGLRLDAAAVDNQGGLITSGATLELTADTLDSSHQGEVSAKGDLYLRVAELIQRQGALIGEAGVTLDLRGGLLDNRGGLISAVGPLSIDNLRALDNRQGGEVFSAQSYRLVASSLDNSDQGRLISAGTLSLEAEVLDNSEGGLISGWQGLDVKGGQLDNSARGTLSSKDGALRVTLSGQLDNHDEGALVSHGDQHIVASGLNNGEGGIVSSQGALDLELTGQLDNLDAGLISAQGELRLQARDTHNRAGQIVAGQALHLRGTSLDNTAGVLSSASALTLALQGDLLNADQAQLASAGPLRIEAGHIDNRGGNLVSQGVLTLLAASLENSDAGTLLARQALAIRLTAGLDNRADGLIYSQTDGLLVEAGSVVNDGGTLQSEGDLSVLAGTDLSSQQGRLVSASGDLHLRAANLDNQGGILDSAAGHLQLDIAGLFDNRGGTVQGQSLEVTSADLDNDGGHLSAIAGDSRIQARALSNRDGGLYAQGALELRADSFANANGQVAARHIDFGLGGTLNNQGGLIESESQLLLRAASLDNQGGSLRSLGSVGATYLDIGLLDNRGGLIETANSDLRLQVGTLDNLAGLVRHLGSGAFGLTTAQVLAAGGSLVTGSVLDISAATWVNSSLLQAARLVLNVGHFTQTASGQLLASDSFSGSGDTWINHGLLASDGDLSLTLSGAYSGDGRLSSLGDLSLSAADITLAQNARISAGGLGGITSSGRLSNQGVLTAVGDLSLVAAQLDNRGTLGGSAGLRITTPYLSNDNGLLFSGADMTLQVGDFVNYQADVYSLGDLDILGQVAGSRANLIDNNSGTLESVGDLRIQAATLRNQRDRFVTEQQRVSGNISVYWDDYCDGRGCEWYFTSVERFEEVIVDGSASAAGFIGAGGDLSFSGSLFDNRHSTVSAGGDITIGTEVFNNIGAGGGEERHLRSGVYTRDRGIYNTFIRQKNLFNQYNDPNSASYAPATLSRDQVIASAPNGAYYQTSSYVVPVAGSVVASAIVQAAGSVNITASEQLNNSVLRSATAYVGDTSRGVDTTVDASTTPLPAITSQLPPDLAHKQINPLSLPGFSLPSGQNGLFRLNQQAGQDALASAVGGAGEQAVAVGQGVAVGDTEQRQQAVTQPGQQVTLPDGSGQPEVPVGATPPLAVGGVQAVEQPVIPGNSHKYLIETNPAFASLGNFLNSDYLLGLLGYDPDQAQKRLGDGLYEQRLIREAIVARTGQRFIAGLDSDEAMFRYLMDNAIASKEALNLSLGVSLSAAQVAALTHDIVWMEEQEVLGEMVLVPVLYLAQPDNRLMANGALIQGRDVTLISGGELNNSGTLRASNDLAASATTIDNRGLIEAGNRLELLATDSIRNAAGGIIAGRDVSLIARDGDIINERSVTTVSGSGSGYQYRADVVTAASRIEAANDLSLVAGRDVHSLGSVIQAGGDAHIEAGRDVLIASQREEDRYSYQQRRETGSQYQVTQHASELQVGGDLAISAGRDLGIIASRVEAVGDITLQAAENLVVAAAANESHEESYRKHAGKKTQRIESSVSQQQAEIEAGGSLVAVSGSDMTLVASDLRSGDEAFFYAGGELSLLAEQNSDYSLYDMQKKGSWGSKKTQRDEVTTVRNVGTTITSGGELTLVSEGDQLYQRARLDSGADLTLESGGAITFEAVKDLDQESHEKSKSSSMWTSAKGKGSTDETLLQSQMLAQGDIVIKAVDGLNIDVKQVNQQTVSQTIDAMVKADPELAWLKEMEQRGDVDWHRVKEVHDSFKYSHSGLGGAAAMIIAIVVAYFTAGAASGLVAGAAGAGGASTAAGAAWATTVTTAAGTTAAGWANVAATAVLTSAASNAAISTINNRGNLGAVLDDTFSSGNLKGYATSALTAGFTSGVLDSAFGVTGDNVNKVTKGFDLSKAGDLAKFGSYLGAQGAVQAVAQTAIQGGSLGDNLQSTLTNQVQHLLQAGVFNAVGDFADGKNWAEGSPEKIALHAVVGGLLSEAIGGDFKTGALAGGANELLVEQLAGVINGDKNLELAVSQLIGVAAATATGGDPAKAAELAKNATAYNRHLHDYEKQQLEKEAEKLRAETGKSKTGLPWDDLLLIASGAELDAAENARLQAVANIYGGESNPEFQNFVDDMSRAYAVINDLASQNVLLTWSDGKAITAHGEPVYAFQATQDQYLDSNLFNTYWSDKQSTSYHASYTELVPGVWKEQFGTADANRYLREIAQAAATSPDALDAAFERMATVAYGGILPVTWDVDIAMSLAGAGAGKLTVDATKNLAKWLSSKTSTKGTLDTVDRVTTGIEWGKGIQGQGMPWENYLASQVPASSRLPANFKTFDFFDEATKAATSAKTLDTTTAAKIANPGQVYSSLKGNIDAVVKFDEYTLGSRTLYASQIASREVQVAIPKATTPAQWVEINKAIQYAKSQEVKLTVTVIE
ncbi:two-partner secretion domain-containing protein [Phytopseudomonas dryadis]|nr:MULTISPECIES: DUF637 domain-containing protein [Pseudomonas]